MRHRRLGALQWARFGVVLLTGGFGPGFESAGAEDRGHGTGRGHPEVDAADADGHLRAELQEFQPSTTARKSALVQGTLDGEIVALVTFRGLDAEVDLATLFGVGDDTLVASSFVARIETIHPCSIAALALALLPGLAHGAYLTPMPVQGSLATVRRQPAAALQGSVAFEARRVQAFDYSPLTDRGVDATARLPHAGRGLQVEAGNDELLGCTRGVTPSSALPTLDGPLPATYGPSSTASPLRHCRR
ncbi:MAG: hypothetical protein EA356_15125 [Geminicoccaceae bacterium]|nr:MAG: hypothetical protein EA356_15125 [Geminicoccaceae bacterium]